MAEISEAKRRLQDYHYAIENPASLPVEMLAAPGRWAHPNFRDELGLAPTLRAMPSPESPEGKTAVRVANLIHGHYLRLTDATVEDAITSARSLSDKLYCHVLHKARVKFPHQDADRFDPGYRMTVALPLIMVSLFDAAGHDKGVNVSALSELGDGLAEFHSVWAVDADVRFLPVRRLAQFLQTFVGIVRPA